MLVPNADQRLVESRQQEIVDHSALRWKTQDHRARPLAAPIQLRAPGNDLDDPETKVRRRKVRDHRIEDRARIALSVSPGHQSDAR